MMDDIPRLSPEMASRKNQVLLFIRAYFTTHGVGPSLSEIAAAVGTNRSRVQDAIRKLEREQRVHRQPGKARGVRPISDHAETLRKLEKMGYVFNSPMPLLDIDAGDRLIVTDSTVTNASLPDPCARAHGARRQGDATNGESEEGTGSKGRRADDGDEFAAA